MEAIFNKSKIGEDIFMCSVPVPDIDAHKYDSSVQFTEDQISKYGQSQTHPSICFRENGFGGHQWWLATTPYPYAVGVFENPCIYYADTKSDGTPPTVFTPIPNNPIVKIKENSATNSDPDLLIDDELGKMWLISRDNVFQGHAAFLQESSDGISLSERPYKDKTKVVASNIIEPFIKCPELISPSLLKIDGKYLYFAVSGSSGIYSKNDKANKGRFWGIYAGESTELMQANDCFTYIGKSAFLSNAIEPWHFDCFYDYTSGYIYAICSGPKYLNWENTRQNGVWLAVSKDQGKTFVAYPRPLLLGSFYRPTAVLDSERNLVIYGCFESGAPTSAEKYPNGTSDIPVDGRAIFMCYKNFDKLLADLNKDVISIQWE